MLLQPLPLVIHEVPKPAGVGIEGIPQKREVSAGETLHLRYHSTVKMKARALSSVQYARGSWGRYKLRAEGSAGVVTHLEKMIQSQHRQRVVGIFQLARGDRGRRGEHSGLARARSKLSM